MAAVLVQLPNLGIDTVVEDVLDAYRASVNTSDNGPWDLTGAPVLTLSTDSAAGQTFTMLASYFVDPEFATSTEVAAVINSTIVGGLAVAATPAATIQLYSTTYGSASTVQVSAGGANTAIDFDTILATGGDASTVPFLINRIPEDGEEEVAANSSIVFSVFRSDGVAAPSTDITVTVEGAPAITAGVFQPGFTGAFALVDAATRRVTITPGAAFSSSQLVDVVVTVTGYSALQYDFVVKDTTRPQVVSAVAQGIRVVRIRFNELMDIEAAGLVDTATYTFVRNSVIAVNVEPVAVAVVDAYSVDVTTDIPLTFGANYTVTVGAGAVDIRGNVVGPAPNDAAAFQGYNPEVPEGRRFLLWDWIPETNKRNDVTRDLATFISVLQEPTNLMLHEVDRLADVIDYDTASEEVLDVMLADLGNPFRVDLDVQDKRRLVSVLVEIYQSKGTKAGIEDVINFLLGIPMTVDTFTGSGWALGVEALDDDAVLGPDSSYALYSFTITSPVALTDTERQRVRDIANYMRCAHEHLVSIIEPTTPIATEVYDHLELGFSRLGINWLLH